MQNKGYLEKSARWFANRTNAVPKINNQFTKYVKARHIKPSIEYTTTRGCFIMGYLARSNVSV